MRDKRLNLKWARKLMKAKTFVVCTETESFIAIEGINPNNLNDMLTLQAQQASIDSFITDLEGLREAHQRKVQELGGQVGITREEASAKDVPKTDKAPAKSRAKAKTRKSG
jgi:hypothetical protein